MALLGTEALKKDFRELKKLAGPVALRKAARAGARVIRDEARRGLGKSRRSQGKIITRDTRTGDKASAASQVTIAANGFYLRFIHSGTKAHLITAGKVGRIIDPKSRKIVGKFSRLAKHPRLALHFGNQLLFRYSVTHPGVRNTNPFLTRAADVGGTAAAQAVADSFAASLDQIKAG
jgi:HK97 gp10 family phage protein